VIPRLNLRLVHYGLIEPVSESALAEKSEAGKIAGLQKGNHVVEDGDKIEVASEIAIIQSWPFLPGQIFLTKISGKLSSIQNKHARKLLSAKIRSCGRNCYGRITSHRRGGGHKRQDQAIVLYT
jgi:hypothetical protein